MKKKKGSSSGHNNKKKKPEINLKDFQKWEPDETTEFMTSGFSLEFNETMLDILCGLPKDIALPLIENMVIRKFQKNLYAFVIPDWNKFILIMSDDLIKLRELNFKKFIFIFLHELTHIHLKHFSNLIEDSNIQTKMENELEADKLTSTWMKDNFNFEVKEEYLIYKNKLIGADS
ncbi:hypothetical protein LCGC14_2184930 [marine sediment metagenome]|uniref:Uncharacterized protein n=1 Tax=marine sediment metagenome TaxID=412755 RepID=A0A0F9FYM5_9ZZZZ